MKQQTERFTPAALTLSVVTAALADGIPQSVSVCRALWLGAVSAVCLCILSALAVAMLQNKAPSLAVRLALTAGLFMELVHTLVQAQGLCTAEFSSMALLGFLPLLLWAGWAVPPASWNASARVLWWFAAVGGVVCLLGLAGQLHWYRLFTPAQPTAANWDIPVYAEYFAGALLCSARSARRTVWLPVWGFAVQAAALLGSALLFGSGTYPRLELLRAWSGGSFSRMDALLLLLWLLCAVYRAAMLCAAIRLLWLEGERIGIRRCTVSVTLQKGQVLVRLDCQRAAHSPLPTQAQRQQLAAQCTTLLQSCWQQGVDVLHLQARAALRSGSIAGFDPTKNACPQWRTDVHFMLY